MPNEHRATFILTRWNAAVDFADDVVKIGAVIVVGHFAVVSESDAIGLALEHVKGSGREVIRGHRRAVIHVNVFAVTKVIRARIRSARVTYVRVMNVDPKRRRHSAQTADEIREIVVLGDVPERGQLHADVVAGRYGRREAHAVGGCVEISVSVAPRHVESGERRRRTWSRASELAQHSLGHGAVRIRDISN